MKRTALLFAVAVFCFSFVQSAHAVTVYHQPTPYPTTVDTARHHIWDGWITNIYYGKTFVQDDRLQIGGWGDVYRTYVKFDVSGLPQNVSKAVLWTMSYPRGDNSTPTVVNFNLITSNWSTTMTWNTQPTVTYLGWRGALTANQWWGTIITQWYSGWKANPSTNYGLRLDPQSTANNFDVFRSSRYSTPHASDGARPMFQLDFTPTLELKMPLSGGLSWLETTEPGGYSCMGYPYNQWHDNNDYFSIDFDNLTKEVGAYVDAPVLAAAGGTVVNTGWDSNGVGNFIVINHTNPTQFAGFTTRYYHLKNPPARQNGTPLVVGNLVSQGDQIGIVGNTGLGYTDSVTGTHLHFGVRYDNVGAVTRPELAYVVMAGRLLKSYQTECAVNSNGVPTTWNRYWLSGNRVYP